VTHISNRSQMGGFTLIEVGIAGAILGILVAIALPSYLDGVNKSRRADAKAALLDLSARQERFMAQTGTYSTAISANSGLNLGRTTSADGYYNLAAAACSGGAIANCFSLTATATGAQIRDTDCAIFSVDNRRQKTSKNKAGSTTTDCW
jgi:type IV pilus assembly protein PilE